MRNMLYKIPRRNFSTLKAAKFTLPALGYGYDELEPVFSKELLELHHGKHHANYINTYNDLVVDFADALEKGDVHRIETLTKDLNFNAGSHLNHSIFWKNLTPIKSKQTSFNFLNEIRAGVKFSLNIRHTNFC